MFYDGFLSQAKSYPLIEYMYSIGEYCLVCHVRDFISKRMFPSSKRNVFVWGVLSCVSCEGFYLKAKCSPLVKYMCSFGEYCPVCTMTGFISREVFPSARIHVFVW